MQQACVWAATVGSMAAFHPSSAFHPPPPPPPHLEDQSAATSHEIQKEKTRWQQWAG